MKKPLKQQSYKTDLILEELEARQLFSGGIEGLVDTSLISAIYEDEDKDKNVSSGETGSNTETAAETQSHELVFVDTAVDDYQILVDDLINNADSNRNFEVILLDSEQNGIDVISQTLQGYEDLDAIHIISHGSDGNVVLGNTSLNADTLGKNNFQIAMWANAFAETGDILVYGCNLAETEDGQSLVNNLSELTLADVAASDDLTGHESLGGDWELEYAQGQIETDTLIDQDTADQWHSLLAPPTAADNTISTHEDTTYTFAANDFGYSDADGDAMVSVKITTLESVGDLKLNGAGVTLNQVITKADIDNDLLTFTSAADGNGTGYDSFGFSVNDGASDSASTYTMTMD
ncbi:MAG: DUF4347 domain-containing protein, partial [Gammaproteobacteria bacterium]|nr:DUF4347 domain-containing protein [Gammaproteobacteria bacterium]